jgi:hypothetical protein
LSPRTASYGFLQRAGQNEALVPILLIFRTKAGLATWR